MAGGIKLTADVCWGLPHGGFEASFPEDYIEAEWPEATPEAFRELGESLPRLVREFEDAVTIGRSLC